MDPSARAHVMQTHVGTPRDGIVIARDGRRIEFEDRGNIVTVGNGNEGEDGRVRRTAKFLSGRVERLVEIDFGSEVLAGGEMFKSEQRTPVADAASTRILLNDFDFPQGVRRRRRCGRGATGRPKKNDALLSVIITGEKLLLFSVKQSNDVALRKEKNSD